MLKLDHFLMRILYLCLGLVSLLLCAGCGSNSGGVPGFIPKGNFSNASLNGQYVYQIEGFNFSNPNNVVPYRESGVFTANGNKVIQSINIDDEFLKAADKEELEELLIVAINKALVQAENVSQSEMAALTKDMFGGLGNMFGK